MGMGAWGTRKKKEETKEEERFNVYTAPSELAGIQNIWRIVLESKNQEVNEKSSKLLIDLYKSISGDIKKNAKEITDEGVATSMNKIEEI